MSTPSKKELAEQLDNLTKINKILKENSDLTSKLSEEDKSRLLVAQSSLDNLSQRKKDIEAELDVAKARLKMMKESDTLDRATLQRQQKKIEGLKESKNFLEDEAAAIRKQTAAAKNNYEEVKKSKVRWV